MSLLKVHLGNEIEYQKDGYRKLCPSILDVEGDYIPAWYFESDYSYELAGGMRLQLLDTVQLRNKVISVLSSELLSGYTVVQNSGEIYALKQAETLTSGIYRLEFYMNTGIENLLHYSDLFRKI